MQKYLIALDQGTTSSRTVLFDLQGNILTKAQYEFRQIYPREGYVEHDPLEILESQLRSLTDVLEEYDVQPGQVAAIGITNQRETAIVWEKATGKPVYNAIVWQCRRTAPLCEQLIAEGLSDHVQRTTGLLIDAYFSATKIRYILDAIPEGQARAERGELLFGTVDTWLIWNLTGKHVTDMTNASRTMLFDIRTLQWDDTMLQRLNIPRCMLPEVCESAGIFGAVKCKVPGLRPVDGVPIAGAAGDQQAALFGQACFDTGMAKCTYGTGGFLMMQVGDTPILSRNRLLTTIAWGCGGKVRYALEGSIFNAGSAVKWLRDDLKLIGSAHEVDILAEQVPDAGGAYFVSAFTGLGAPHWDMYARGTFMGLTRATGRPHIARAVLEGIAYQIADLSATMEDDARMPLQEIRVDGGLSVSNVTMQFQADILNKRVIRPACVESTALGAAMLAGLGAGVYQSEEEIRAFWQSEAVFDPAMPEEEIKKRLSGWHRAVERSLRWAEED